ncbi:hypothetical protein GJ496_005511 [Pomphorhynchus laevis]|nr:hypothetical protein GJ496_005511 [Pomphorhynchus laevis]
MDHAVSQQTYNQSIESNNNSNDEFEKEQEELNDLLAEADMPFDQLLSRYQLNNEQNFYQYSSFTNKRPKVPRLRQNSRNSATSNLNSTYVQSKPKCVNVGSEYQAEVLDYIDTNSDANSTCIRETLIWSGRCVESEQQLLYYLRSVMDIRARSRDKDKYSIHYETKL